MLRRKYVGNWLSERIKVDGEGVENSVGVERMEKIQNRETEGSVLLRIRLDEGYNVRRIGKQRLIRGHRGHPQITIGGRVRGKDIDRTYIMRRSH